jgi:hypothetical protein
MYSGLACRPSNEKETRIDACSSIKGSFSSLIFRSLWIAVCFFAGVISASAQEALQNMAAGDSAAKARSQQMQSPQNQDYTFKKGDFQLMVVPAMSLEWNDNVNLAQTNALDDFIVTPSVDISALYPFTQRNVLNLDFTIGYDWYLKHPEFSSFDLNSSSGTGLSFDLGIKDVTINFHDWVNYTQGAGQNASPQNTANGSIANTATYGTFQNTIGFSPTWDLNQIKLSAGYDHQNVLATTSQFDSQNHSAEMLFFRINAQVLPDLSIGLETTAAYTSYQKTDLNNNDAYTIGPTITFQPDPSFSLTAKAGYSTYLFQHTSAGILVTSNSITTTTNIQTSDQNSWYASLNLTHKPTDFLSYSLEVGRETQLGTSTDLLQDWYVRPNADWTFIKGVSLNTFFFYEHGHQGVGSVGSLPGVPNSSNSTFNWYGGGLGLSHELTSRFALSLNYRVTSRSSSQPNDGYFQNLVTLQLSYHPKK